MRVAVLPLLLGLAFFSASLTPSLIPRPWLVQGALGGLVAGIGYLIGHVVLVGWRFLELPRLSGRAARLTGALVSVPILIALIWTLVEAAAWQDSIRSHVGMEAVDELHTLGILTIAVAVFAVCLVIGWAIRRLFDATRHRLYRFMPRRTADALGLVIVVAVVFVLMRDGVVRAALEGLDVSYAAAQYLFADAPPAPTDPRVPGSSSSLVDWDAMGQPGRDFVLNGPDAGVISAFTGRPAKDPIRVYVGRAQSPEPEARAQVALEELLRLGAFERRVLIVASPTGTGWLDPGGHDPVEFMHDGDIATVAVQYSYLQSPLALIFETRSGLDQATATMRAVYDYWKKLPENSRPELYLHGISLGAWSSMYSFEIFEIINDPIHGALWTGPPFPSQLWRRAVAAREPGSPHTLPIVGEGELVRFMSQFGGLERSTGSWGRLRIVYLQHASDPIVFYEPESLWRAPEWMREPFAPDVSPEIRFVPVVTQFQLALDMALALGVPGGFGHNYAAEDYVDAWVAVTAPSGWTARDSARLKQWCGPDWGLGCRGR